MNKRERLMGDRHRAGKIDHSLWNFSVNNQKNQARWETNYDRMTEEEKDGWLAWDEEWLTSKDVRDGYAVLMALEKL